MMGMVPQEQVLFHDTIRANLLVAKRDATEEELINACKVFFFFLDDDLSVSLISTP
jgi:ABC-type multidrug transport system fused ATPase/permease subunit